MLPTMMYIYYNSTSIEVEAIFPLILKQSDEVAKGPLPSRYYSECTYKIPNDEIIVIIGV